MDRLTPEDVARARGLLAQALPPRPEPEPAPEPEPVPLAEPIEARRNLRAGRLADHVAKALADAPPLSDEQRQSIARLLTSAGGGGAS